MSAASVAEVVATWPALARTQFQEWCDFIRDHAKADGVPLEETLKWGTPSFVPPRKSGTTIRINWSEKSPDQMGLYVHCGTSIITELRALYPAQYDGSRGLIWALDSAAPRQAAEHLISRALHYHRG